MATVKVLIGNIKGVKGDKGDPGKSAYQSAKEAGYTGTESAFASDLAKVGGKADAAHAQAASTITAGTFAGQVAASASGQSPSVSCLRNSKFSFDENDVPTVEGETVWYLK